MKRGAALSGVDVETICASIVAMVREAEKINVQRDELAAALRLVASRTHEPRIKRIAREALEKVEAPE